MAVKADYRGRIKTTISAEVEVELRKNDIYNWLQNCEDPAILRYLGQAAFSRAHCLEHPELVDHYDDFRSRA